MISGEINGDLKVRGWMMTLAQDVIRRVEIVIGVDTQILSRRAQGKAASSHAKGSPKGKSGELARAVAHGTFMKREGKKYSGTVGLKGASKAVSIYGASVEYGATHPERIQEALAGSVLRFQVGGKWVFAKKVTIPGFTIPAHSFLRSTLSEMRPKILQDLANAAKVDEASLQ